MHEFDREGLCSYLVETAGLSGLVDRWVESSSLESTFAETERPPAPRSSGRVRRNDDPYGETVHPDPCSEQIARNAKASTSRIGSVSKVEERDDIETQLFDVCDFHLPYDHYGTEIKEQFPEWRDAIIRADGLVIVTPEYNHGPPGPLKSVLDLLLKEYIHKAVAFVGVSAGPWGGTRVIEAMVPSSANSASPSPSPILIFRRSGSSLTHDGNLLDEAYNKRAEAFLDELVWMATTLRWGRENVPSKHHHIDDHNLRAVPDT